MADIDYIKLRPDRIGWTLIVYTEDGVTEYGIGDAIQFHSEVDRTLGQWLADGPADFHGAPPVPPAVIDYDRKENMTMTEWIPITGDEAATLNAARDVLDMIQTRAFQVSGGDMLKIRNAGQLEAICESADSAVFQVLNHASCYGDTLDPSVLHNRKEKV